MVKIRLQRHGKRNDPFYRVVAIEHTQKRGGQALEILGHWYPKKDDKKLEKKKIDVWVKKGAQITPAVKKLM